MNEICVGDIVKLKFSNTMIGIVYNVERRGGTLTCATNFYFVYTAKNRFQTYTDSFLEIVVKCVK